MVSGKDPHGFTTQPIVFLVVGLEAGKPSHNCWLHLGNWAIVQFAASTVARAPFRLAQLFQDFRGRLAKLCYRLQQRPALGHKAVNAAPHMIAARVALAVLHVAHQGVGPVAKPQGAIRTNLWVGWTKMLIGGLDQVVCLVVFLHTLAFEARSVVSDGEPRHTVHVDNTGISKLLLHIVGEVPAHQPFAP